jgi:acetoin utilization deacetylase AcuC-like enzyme
MATFLYFDADCIAHDPGPGHPEQPARLAAVRDALAAPEFADLKRQLPRSPGFIPVNTSRDCYRRSQVRAG